MSKEPLVLFYEITAPTVKQQTSFLLGQQILLIITWKYGMVEARTTKMAKHQLVASGEVWQSPMHHLNTCLTVLSNICSGARLCVEVCEHSGNSNMGKSIASKPY